MKKGVKIAIGAVGAVVATATVYLVGFVCGWGAAKDDGFDPDKDEELGEMEFYEDSDEGPAVGSTEGLFDDETEITDENDEVDNSMFDGEEGEE